MTWHKPESDDSYIARLEAELKTAEKVALGLANPHMCLNNPHVDCTGIECDSSECMSARLKAAEKAAES
jgi:hypothetical protein